MALALLPAAAPGQIFAKKAKVVPSQRVPELIVIVKTDPDERKRASAAEELHLYDVKTFTEIVPVLVDVLQHDKKVSVRLEAVTSLAKIRPVSTMAGQALEKAAADDEAWRVRMHARTSLPKYHLAGYTSKAPEPAPVVVNKKVGDPPAVIPGPPPTPIPPPPVSPGFPRPLPPGVVTPATPPPPAQGPSLFP
jgi:hypothetical protein